MTSLDNGAGWCEAEGGYPSVRGHALSASANPTTETKTDTSLLLCNRVTDASHDNAILLQHDKFMKFDVQFKGRGFKQNQMYDTLISWARYN